MRPKVIAHRGASHLAPENTLSAFRLAINMGVDGVEFDTLLTADNQLVVHHEYITDLHCPVHKVIPQCTLAELKTLDFGSWKGEKWAGEQIPTLAEALDVCSAVDHIQVEFKSPLGPTPPPTRTPLPSGSWKRWKVPASPIKSLSHLSTMASSAG